MSWRTTPMSRRRLAESSVTDWLFLAVLAFLAGLSALAMVGCAGTQMTDDPETLEERCRRDPSAGACSLLDGQSRRQRAHPSERVHQWET